MYTTIGFHIDLINEYVLLGCSHSFSHIRVDDAQ